MNRISLVGRLRTQKLLGRTVLICIIPILLTILLVLLIVLQVVVDTQATITIQRAITCALLFIGLRNLLELVATLYFDRQM